MGDLRVTVRYHGVVIEDRVLQIRNEIRLGESAQARVNFPGADLAVSRVGETLELGERQLLPGQRTGFSMGAVHVQLENVEQVRLATGRSQHFDPRFLMIALGVTAGGMWIDTLAAVAANPRGGEVAAQIEQIFDLLPAPSRGEEKTAAVRLNSELGQSLSEPEAIDVEGRRATPDDDMTGWAYYSWYTAAVPRPDREALRARLLMHLEDPELYAIRARDAYNQDRYEEALLNYEWLHQHDPRELEWAEGLARAHKRLGRHSRELELYEQILERDPHRLLTLGNRAVALARVGSWDEVPEALDRMHTADPDHPYNHVFEALCASLQGREAESLEHLDQALGRRGAMSDALQLELRRDLALDPALAPLRKDRRLRVLLYRHFGAAAPQPKR